MKKFYAVILTVFITLSFCGFDIIWDRDWRSPTPTPQPGVSDKLPKTGDSLFSFVRRLFGADKTGTAKIEIGNGTISHPALIAGAACAVLLAAAVYFLVIRKRINSRTS